MGGAGDGHPPDKRRRASYDATEPTNSAAGSNTSLAASPAPSLASATAWISPSGRGATDPKTEPTEAHRHQQQQQQQQHREQPNQPRNPKAPLVDAPVHPVSRGRWADKAIPERAGVVLSTKFASWRKSAEAQSAHAAASIEVGRSHCMSFILLILLIIAITSTALILILILFVTVLFGRSHCISCTDQWAD